MWLVKKQYNPLQSVFDFGDDFMSDIFDSSLLSKHLSEKIAPVELSEDKKAIQLQFELPGFGKKDISIDYKDGYLSIHAESKEQQPKSESENYYSERRYGTVKRTVYVGDVNFDKAKATLLNGLLNITLPKVEEAKPLQLDIQ